MLLLFVLHLLMDDFHVPVFLVQLLLLICWTGGLSLLASGLSERESILVCVQWLQCSPWRCYLLRRHDEGWCFAEDGRKRVHQRWASMLETCSQMLWIKNKATQKKLMVNALRPSKHYFPEDITIFGRRSRRTYLLHCNIQRYKYDCIKYRESMNNHIKSLDYS